MSNVVAETVRFVSLETSVESNLSPIGQQPSCIEHAVFIDAAVSDCDKLIEGLRPGATAHILRSSDDGIRQIAAALAERTNLARVSIIAHGLPGSVTLGSIQLDWRELPNHGANLAQIGRAMSLDGVLQLFACEAGKGLDGRALVQELARMTGQVVAASSRQLGGAEGEGCWSLDVESAPTSEQCLPIAAPTLAAYAYALAGANPPPAGFPLDVQDFSVVDPNGGQFIRRGDATISGGNLQLTTSLNNQAGIAVYDQSFSSNLGLSVQFTYESRDGSVPGADGISFFLLNGDTVTGANAVQAGGYGGGLGYSINNGNGNANGITGGFVGVGFDTFGNYAQGSNGQAASNLRGPNGQLLTQSQTANYVGVRGASNASTPYGWLTGAPYAPGIDGTRTVQVNLTKLNSTQEQLQVYIEPSGSNTFTKVIDTVVSQPLPSKFYFGFAASTGGSKDLHQIDAVSVKLPVNLTFGTATVQNISTGQTNPATLNPGDEFTYSYTLSNDGPNDDAQIAINDLLPANVINSGWTITDSAGTRTGAGGVIAANLLSGAHATITVTGRVDPDSTSGNATHQATVSPGDAYSLADPNEAVGVRLNIGASGSSVSLVGANQVVAATDTAASAPFAAASIVDTYVDPSNGSVPIDQLRVRLGDTAAGTLQAANATYDAATGILSASGTPADLQAILRSIVFTPVAYRSAPGAATSVALDTTVTDNQNQTAGVGASASQSETVTITATHDTPTISGAAANQAASDNATVTPFAGLVIADPDNTGATVSVTVSGGAAKGQFTAASSAGWTQSAAPNGDLVYTQTLPAQQSIGAAVQAAVRALVFQPAALTSLTGASATVGLTVNVADAVSPSFAASDANTSLLVQDATAPAPVTLALATASDSGAVGDGLTNVMTPAIAGLAEPGSTVNLYDGSTLLGSVQAAADGTWSIVSSTLNDGPHALTATATDAAGNVSALSAALPVTIDTAPPPVAAALAFDTGSLANDGVTGNPTLTGSAEAGATVTVSEAGQILGTASADSQGQWQFTPQGLADGAHSIAVSETDTAGNTGLTQATFTLDTVAPLVTAALLHDTGLSVTDGITFDPTLTGGGDPGAAVSLTEAGQVVGSAIADAQGRWTAPVSVGDGAHTITVSETDAAGNTGTAAPSFTLVTTPPSPIALALAPASDSGVAGDGVTSVSAPTITSTGVPGSTVRLYDGANLIGSAIVPAGGMWSFTTSALAEGGHALSAEVVDIAGNVSARSAALPLTIDTTLPAVTATLLRDTGASAADGLTSDASLSGTGDPGATVTVSEAGQILGTANADSQGQWQFTPQGLADGAHSIAVSETDTAGNTGLTQATFTLDTVAPLVTAALLHDTGVSATDGITSDPTLTGGGDPGAAVSLTEAGQVVGSAIADAQGRWGVTLQGLADGVHAVTATETDTAGNLASVQTVFTLIATAPAPPAVQALAPASDSGVLGDGVTNVTAPTITGLAAPGSAVQLYDGTTLLGAAQAAADGTWSIVSPVLAEGVHALTATGTDAAGNVSAASLPLPITIDATPPATTAMLLHDTGTSATDRITSDPALTGGGDPGALITFSEAGQALGSALADAQGQWTFTPAGLADGVHTVEASETDAAGNTSTAQSAFTLDTVPPALTAALLHDTGTSATDGVTSDPTVSGEGADPGAAVTLGEAGQTLGTAVADARGHWSFTPAGLADGPHALTAQETDLAGNAVTAQVALTIKARAPAAPVGLTLLPASDSGAQGDGITNVTQPAIVGTGEPGNSVSLYDGTVLVGAGQVAADGTWSIASPGVADGLHPFTATATDLAGNVSARSAALPVTILTRAPIVTASATKSTANAQPVTLLTGSGNPNATVEISEQGQMVGTATARADGEWSFDPSSLRIGEHTFVATETDAAGNAGSAPAVTLTVVDPRFDLSNLTTSASGSFSGADYVGPVSYLKAQYIYSGTDNVVLAARVPNVYLRGGEGRDALIAKSGSNVLEGGGGSDWLVGASGADGGKDTFFLDGRTSQNGWNTILNFHAGDMLTLWGFDPSTDRMSWMTDAGQPGYQGATLRLGYGASGSTLVTFAGLDLNNANVSTSTGESGGTPYLALTRTETAVDPRFDLSDQKTTGTGTFVGADYSGPVNYLQAQYIYSGTDDVTLAARTPNVFMRGGKGQDAIVAKSGSNVLEGGGGSDWLVGASGMDGGTDTFFLDAGTSKDGWSTILNFHAGDMLTLWGFDAGTDRMSWLAATGTPGYQGATLRLDYGSGSSTLVTFAGLDFNAATVSIATAVDGSRPYLALTRTS